MVCIVSCSEAHAGSAINRARYGLASRNPGGQLTAAGVRPRDLQDAIVADLASAEQITPEHVSEAIQYRTFDRTLWGMMTVANSGATFKAKLPVKGTPDSA